MRGIPDPKWLVLRQFWRHRATTSTKLQHLKENESWKKLGLEVQQIKFNNLFCTRNFFFLMKLLFWETLFLEKILLFENFAKVSIKNERKHMKVWNIYFRHFKNRLIIFVNLFNYWRISNWHIRLLAARITDFMIKFFT